MYKSYIKIKRSQIMNKVYELKRGCEAKYTRGLQSQNLKIKNSVHGHIYGLNSVIIQHFHRRCYKIKW